MAYQIAAIALGPVLLAQGLSVRRRVPRLPEPPGARMGSAGHGPPLRLLVLGDSAAAGVGANHQDEALLGQTVQRLVDRFRVDWTLLAKTGATTGATLRTLERLSPGRFDVVLTSLGVNDVTSGVRLSAWRDQQARLRQKLASDFNAARILISGLPPVGGFPALPQPLRWFLGSRARQFNELLEQDVRKDSRCHFVKLDFGQDANLMAPDGFHPGPAIYSAWAANAADRIVAGFNAVSDQPANTGHDDDNDNAR